MANDLKSVLQNVSPDDLQIDRFGRLVINLPGLGKKIEEAAPGALRVPGAAASNNCDCGSGGGGSKLGNDIQPGVERVQPG